MKKKIVLTIGVLIILAGVVLGCMGLYKHMAEKHAGKVYEDIKVEHDVESLIDLPQLQLEKIENPIDFASLTAQYPDVYAWITIPGTRIDYPIVQHPSDNGYYLNHTVDGRKRIEGAIYTENYNSKDFSDPNTLIYGHNMKNGSMFRALNNMTDKEYFWRHHIFCINSSIRQFIKLIRNENYITVTNINYWFTSRCSTFFELF